jgi:hypothetical protein
MRGDLLLILFCFDRTSADDQVVGGQFFVVVLCENRVQDTVLVVAHEWSSISIFQMISLMSMTF